MPDGGKFVVETASIDLEEGEETRRIGIEPGAYVMRPERHGCGMEPKPGAAFEPFYDKRRKRTGWALPSTVSSSKHDRYGLQPPAGHIFEIYLPGRKNRRVALAANRQPGGSRRPAVEDEDGVRKLCSAVLQSNGYTYWKPPTASPACAI